MSVLASEIINAHKEISLIWALAGYSKLRSPTDHSITRVQNEVWEFVHAVNSFNARSKIIKSLLYAVSRLNFSEYIYLNGDTPARERSRLNYSITNLKTYDMLCVALSWQDHAYSVNIIKTATGYMLIYVNKGDRGHVRNPKSTLVYEFTDTSQIFRLLNGHHSSEAQVHKQKFITARILNSWDKYYNAALSCKFEKKDQKVANCTVANKYLSWHLQLALHLLKNQHARTLIEAWDLSLLEYKRMRIYDRASKIIDLLKYGYHYTDKNYAALLITILTKAHLKGPGYGLTLLAAIHDIEHSIFLRLQQHLNLTLQYGIVDPDRMAPTVWNILLKTFTSHRVLGDFVGSISAARTQLRVYAFEAICNFNMVLQRYLPRPGECFEVPLMVVRPVLHYVPTAPSRCAQPITRPVPVEFLRHPTPCLVTSRPSRLS